MLSIRVAEGREWWVSGTILDRLFHAAIGDSAKPTELENWWHVINANGGLDLSLLDASDAGELLRVLFETADRESALLSEESLALESKAYRAGLARLLELRSGSSIRPSSTSA